MGRPSKLTDKQWAEILSRVVRGENVRALSREFGVSDTAIHKAVGLQSLQVKTVAKQMVDADGALKSLPISLQPVAISLADEYKATMVHLASSAKLGAMTSHRLASIANRQTDLIDEAAPLEENLATLKSVAAFTATANEAAKTGLSLIAASKGREPSPEDGGAANVRRIERIIIDVED